MSWDLSLMMQPVSLCNSGPLSTGWAQLVVQDTSAVGNALPSTVPLVAVDSPCEPDVTGRSTPLAPAEPEVCLSPIVSSISRLHCRSLSPTRCSRTAPFIVSLMVRQARHRFCIIALPSVCIPVGKDFLSQQTPLGLWTTWEVVPTGSQHSCSRWTVWITASPPTVPGVGGWVRWNLPAYRAGIPAHGSGPCPGCKP